MGGAREPSPLMETKCSSKRSPVPPSAWRELMPSARPPAPRSSSPASSALAPRGDISYLFDLELAHHLNHMLEGLLVFEAVRSRGGATHARTISLRGDYFL